MTSERGNAAGSSGPPLTEPEAEAQAAGTAFKPGPPGQVGVELEWLVCDGRDPALPVDQRRVAAALARLDEPGALPGRGRLTTEPGGQVELSTAPAPRRGRPSIRSDPHAGSGPCHVTRPWKSFSTAVVPGAGS